MQSGFRFRYNSSAAMSDVVNYVVKTQDSGDATMLVHLNYFKTFDMN